MRFINIIEGTIKNRQSTEVWTDDIGQTFRGVCHNKCTIIVRNDMDVNAPESLFNFPLRHNLK
jgi:hypothetical protein